MNNNETHLTDSPLSKNIRNGTTKNKLFRLEPSEIPKNVPTWVWTLIIAFMGSALFHLFLYWFPAIRKSLFE